MSSITQFDNDTNVHCLSTYLDIINNFNLQKRFNQKLKVKIARKIT